MWSKASKNRHYPRYLSGPKTGQEMEPKNGVFRHHWVPSVVMGGGNGAQTAGSGAQELIDLLTVKTAQDLGLDMRIRPPTASGEHT